jgi:hypothetical protein
VIQEEEETTQEEDSGQQMQKSPTPAADLNDSAARARLTGSVDDNAAVILDSFVTAGPSDVTHEEIPSFNEWAQKRLEEVEKKKGERQFSALSAAVRPRPKFSTLFFSLSRPPHTHTHNRRSILARKVGLTLILIDPRTFLVGAGKLAA